MSDDLAELQTLLDDKDFEYRRVVRERDALTERAVVLQLEMDALCVRIRDLKRGGL